MDWVNDPIRQHQDGPLPEPRWIGKMFQHALEALIIPIIWLVFMALISSFIWAPALISAIVR